MKRLNNIEKKLEYKDESDEYYRDMIFHNCRCLRKYLNEKEEEYSNYVYLVHEDMEKNNVNKYEQKIDAFFHYLKKLEKVLGVYYIKLEN